MEATDQAASDVELPCREKRKGDEPSDDGKMKRRRSARLPKHVMSFYRERKTKETIDNFGNAADRKRALQILQSATPTDAPPAGHNAPSAGQVAPSPGEVAPSAPDKSQPAGEDALSAAQDASPAREQRQGTVQDAPSAGQDAPSAGQDVPSAGQHAPSAGQHAPSAGQQAPSAGQQAPSPAPQRPSPVHDVPSPVHDVPSPVQEEPSPRQDAPLDGVHEPSPVHQTSSAGRGAESARQDAMRTQSTAPASDIGSDDDNDDDGECESMEDSTNGPSQDAPETTTYVTHPQLRVLQRRMAVLVRWEKLLSCVAMSGRVRLNAVQYSFLVRALRNANPYIKLRVYKHMTGMFRNKLLAYAFPQSAVYHIGKAAARPGKVKKVSTVNNGECDASECVRVVLPSQWAQLDITSDIFFRAVYENEESSNPEAQSIEQAPIVQNRAVVCGADLVLWALYEDSVVSSEVGDKVRFPCASQPRNPANASIDVGWKLVTDMRTNESASNLSVEGVVGNMVCVNRNFADATAYGCTAEEREVFDLLKKQVYPTFASISETTAEQRTLRETIKKDILLTSPGDVVMFFRTDESSQSGGAFCLFLASPVLHAYGGNPERLVWVRIERPEGHEAYVRTMATATVTNLPRWVSGGRTSPVFRESVQRNKGTLPCGTPYYVYRMAIYADGFQQHKSMTDTRSVTGVYMMPLGLPLDRRRSAAVARVLSLIPDGADERSLFKILEDDLIKTGTEGVVGVDPYGNVARIYIDFVSFFADYPAVTAMTDVRGHNATSFCTFCSMRKKKQPCGRNLLYTSQAHSRRLGFMRFDSRTEAVRAGHPPNDLLKSLGYSKQSREQASRTPLVRYATRVREMVEKGVRPPLNIHFDSHLNVAAAPDHLFTGLISDALHVCFMTLESDDEREDTEAAVISKASANDLQHDGRFLKWDRSKCAGLRSMTMSTRVGILLCAVPLFNRHYARRKNDVFLLPQKLQKFLSLVYYLPSEEADGPAARDQLTKEGALRKHGERYRAISAYIALCRTIFQGQPNHANALNKPNVHRALELCILTIPSFGHARNCSEMVLEAAHRTFKRWLETNTHADAHITGVERTLLRDWLNRAHALYHQWRNGDHEQRVRAETGLLRVLLGQDAVAMDREKAAVTEFMESFKKAMTDAFREPVLEEMAGTDQWGDAGGAAFGWELTNEVDDDADGSSTLQAGLEILDDWYACNGLDDIDLVTCRFAKFMATDSMTGSRRAYAYNKVSAGCAVSVVCKQRSTMSNIIRAARLAEENCTVRFFAVCHIVRASNGDNWCVVKEMTSSGEGFSVRDSNPAVLLLGRRVRRVGLLHVCAEGCRTYQRRPAVVHSESVLGGGVYDVVTRREGYPPHLG